MTILPIVHRELREKVRHPRTSWSRVSVALGAVLMYSLVSIATGSVIAPVALGRGIFRLLIVSGFLACIIAGTRLTSDSLSSEKREGTLGLLFLTDLRGYDIVLGKLASNGLLAFYALMAVAPVLSVCVLSGGVRGLEIMQGTIGLLNTLFLAMSVGLLTSAISENNRRSESAASLIIVVLLLGIPILAHFADQNFKQLQAGSIIKLFGLNFFRFSPIGGPIFSGDFWTTTMVTHLQAWLFLGLASLRLPKKWQDKPARHPNRGGSGPWHAWIYGDRETRALLRRERLDVNPFYWLASRQRFKHTAVWVVMTLAAVAGFASFRASGNLSQVDSAALLAPLMLTGGMWCLILHLWIAANAGNTIFAARSNGSLELLLSTPVSVSGIVRGQWLALQRQFGKPLLAVLSLAVAVIAITLLSEELPNGWSDERGKVVFTVVTILVMVGINAVALGWMGMWLGVRLRDRRRLTASTFSNVWLPTLMITTLFSLLGLPELFESLGLTSLTGFLIFWLTFGSTAALMLILWARRQIRDNFRVMTAQLDERPDSLGRWLGERYVQLRRRLGP